MNFRFISQVATALCVACSVGMLGCESAPPPAPSLSMGNNDATDASVSQDSGSADVQADNGNTDAGIDSEQDLGSQDTAPDVAPVEVAQAVTQDSGPAPECNTDINCDDSNPCTIDVCGNGAKCVHLATPAACDDGNACTDNDTCANGQCKGTAKTCNDNNPCTDDFCVNGKCFQGVNNALCDDNNACTQNDKCQGGSCQGGAAKDCDDNNLCTTDTCDSLKGCMSAPVICEDNDACTTDTCESKTGACAFTVVNCDDGKAWTYDYCDAEGWYNNIPGQCIHDQKWNACQKDSDCSDGNGCTDDVCNSFSGTCNTVTKNCNDYNPCTIDACVPAIGCQNSQKFCDDYNTNTLDTCDSKYGACIYTPIAPPPVVIPPTSSTANVTFSCSGILCEGHLYFGTQTNGSSFDNFGLAQVNSTFSVNIPRSQLCQWGLEAASRLTTGNWPWFGCDPTAPLLSTTTIAVDGVVLQGTYVKHPWTCNGGGQGNRYFSPAELGCK